MENEILNISLAQRYICNYRMAKRYLIHRRWILQKTIGNKHVRNKLIPKIEHSEMKQKIMIVYSRFSMRYNQIETIHTNRQCNLSIWKSLLFIKWRDKKINLMITRSMKLLHWLTVQTTAEFPLNIILAMRAPSIPRSNRGFLNFQINYLLFIWSFWF